MDREVIAASSGPGENRMETAWRDAALGWAAERELAAPGLRETGQWKVRLRPWDADRGWALLPDGGVA
ncbi:hypothetical protein [Streptomyces sp. NPDC126933]|uniref:hypothetical protein n=1 Tax=unclassified Streptomyces TaxID=2593676 RepID=UPI0036591381